MKGFILFSKCHHEIEQARKKTILAIKLIILISEYFRMEISWLSSGLAKLILVFLSEYNSFSSLQQMPEKEVMDAPVGTSSPDETGN